MRSFGLKSTGKQEEGLSEKPTFSAIIWDMPNINEWYEDPKKAQPRREDVGQTPVEDEYLLEKTQLGRGGNQCSRGLSA